MQYKLEMQFGFHATHAISLLTRVRQSLEHLVLAMPPFDPADVYSDEVWQDPAAIPQPFIQPPVNDCFDGAKIIVYEFGNIVWNTVSVAFGWVIADPSRRKQAHCHKQITEWIYVVEGQGMIEVGGVSYLISRGDWIRINPGEAHALRNNKDQHLVVVCLCAPCFSMNDVCYQ
ncbi:MAG: cupin domain-containing protein [Candidatus Portnoybacteria bacterium]|nr:cupin domain-containing protein [Candidatus Portnoybacteria bacterium]